MTATATPEVRPTGPDRDRRRAGPPRRVPRRRRMRVQRLDLWTVLKVSLAFYLSGVVLMLIAGIVTWTVLAKAGVIGNVESFLGDLLSSNDFHLLSGKILQGAVLLGLVLVALMVILTVVAAALFNVFAELLGGVEVVVEEDD